jgi:Tfp pilus assembly protein PilX
MTAFDRLRQRGIVLPVVLVMLVLMTSVVLYMMRRGAVDERMAANMRGNTTAEAAAAYALRYCETALWQRPPGVQPPAGVTDNPVPTVDAPAAGNPAAWQVDALWNDANRRITLPASLLGANMPDITQAWCLIEDATGELDPAPIELVSNTSGAPVQENTYRKFRVTSEVRGPGAGVERVARMQSEVRMFVN